MHPPFCIPCISYAPVLVHLLCISCILTSQGGSVRPALPGYWQPLDINTRMPAIPPMDAVPEQVGAPRPGMWQAPKG